jgi:hypothetical protein
VIDLPCNAHRLNLASHDQINGALLHTGRAVALQAVPAAQQPRPPSAAKGRGRGKGNGRRGRGRKGGAEVPAAPEVQDRPPKRPTFLASLVRGANLWGLSKTWDSIDSCVEECVLGKLSLRPAREVAADVRAKCRSQSQDIDYTSN